MENKKLVVIVKDNLEIGKAMNTVAHAMLGFGTGVVNKEEIKLNKYEDIDENVHDNISEMPIIILKASSNKIRNLRQLAIKNDIKFVDFVDTMSIGTFEEEYNLTKTKKDEELNYLAIILFGDNEIISEWTRKFSLYR